MTVVSLWGGEAEHPWTKMYLTPRKKKSFYPVFLSRLMTANITLTYFSNVGLVSTLWPTTPGTVAGQNGRAGPLALEHADLEWPSGVEPATVRGKDFLDLLNDMAYPDVAGDISQQFYVATNLHH
jgi:hypothetical protein